MVAVANPPVALASVVTSLIGVAPARKALAEPRLSNSSVPRNSNKYNASTAEAVQVALRDRLKPLDRAQRKLARCSSSNSRNSSVGERLLWKRH